MENTKITRTDSVDSTRLEFTKEGYLIDTPILTGIGVFDYKRADGSISRELRLPEHVFSEASLASYYGKPIIITHSAGLVTKDNVADEIIGTILSTGYADGNDVRAKIIIHDSDVVKKSGKRALSLGYKLELDETPGIWDGQPYDAIQTNIIINHLAIVDEARAGEQARLNMDSKNNKSEGVTAEMASTNQQITNDELLKQLNFDEGDSDKKDKKDAEEDKKDKKDGEETNKDTEDKEDAEEDKKADAKKDEGDPSEIIAALKKRVAELEGEKDFDKADKATDKKDSGSGDNLKKDSTDDDYREMLKVIRVGDKLNLDGLEDLSLVDAKKAVIKAVTPGIRLDGKDNAYVDVVFDLAKEHVKTGFDRQISSIFNKDTRTDAAQQSGAAAARERMIEKMMNGGKEE